MTVRNKHTCSRIRHRLALQEEVETPDGAGGYARSWQEIACLWGEIIPWKGKELPFAEQLQSRVTHRILLRYREGVTAAMRLAFENRIFNIRYVFATDELRDTLQLLVDEGVAA